MKKWILILVGLLSVESASALTMEIGSQYFRKKTSFDSDNYIDSESVTGSLSFYFWERVALELSYTDAKAVREEKMLSGTTIVTNQTVYQKTQVVQADLIFVLMDRKSFIQPYIKGGAAEITRHQEVKVGSLGSFTLDPEKAVVPSYGAGLKFNVTETFSIKLSYDAWQTPVGGGTVTNDSQIRAGVSWML